MHRLDSYTHEFINPFLLQQKSFLSIKDLKVHNSNFDRIILNISLNRLKSDEDYPIVLAQQYLENITAQKIFFSKKETSYVGTTKTFKISALITLRKRNMYNFIDYFFYVLLPAYNRRYGLLPFGNASKLVYTI
jgi:ribosomal protein L5